MYSRCNTTSLTVCAVILVGLCFTCVQIETVDERMSPTQLGGGAAASRNEVL